MLSVHYMLCGVQKSSRNWKASYLAVRILLLLTLNYITSEKLKLKGNVDLCEEIMHPESQSVRALV